MKPHEISSAVFDKIFYDGHLQMLTSQVMVKHEDDKDLVDYMKLLLAFF